MGSEIHNTHEIFVTVRRHMKVFEVNLTRNRTEFTIFSDTVLPLFLVSLKQSRNNVDLYISQQQSNLCFNFTVDKLDRI